MNPQQYLERFKELEQESKKVQSTKHQSTGIYGSNTYVDGDILLAWMVKVETLITTIFGTTSPIYKTFLEKKKSSSFNTNWDIYNSINAIFIAAKEEYEKGYAINQNKGDRIFIGHGRSPVWRELKDFISEKLGLPWDEFNRVPVAGVTNIARLSEMLNQSCIAFLIMTAEDETADGNQQARMNVIHEVGLFQGKLGFDRAIILLEQGCQEFTNINGLGQIRFPEGNISAIYQNIREVLERENIIQ